MAQGNYVNVGSIDANWGKGLSSALLGLSDTYAKKAANEREEARLAAEAEESKRRFDLQDARAAANAKLQQDEAQRQLEMRDYYGTLGSNMNLDDVRTAKAKQYFNVTDEDLTSPKGRQILDAVPLYQEDVIDYYDRDFVRKFGTGFDPKVLQSFVGDIQSVAGLQAREDEAAKAQREAYKQLLDRNTDIAKALYKEESSLYPKSSRVATFADIDIPKLAGSFNKEGGWFSDSEAEKANVVGIDLLQTLKSEGYNPSNASRIVEATFNKLRRGDALNEIENDPEAIAQALNQAKSEASNYDVSRSNAKSYLDNFLTNNELIGTYLPKNVRLANRAAAQQTINSILGREVLTPSSTTSTKGATEEEILRSIGFNTSDKKDNSDSSSKQVSKDILTPSEIQAITAESRLNNRDPEEDLNYAIQSRLNELSPQEVFNYRQQLALEEPTSMYTIGFKNQPEVYDGSIDSKTNFQTFIRDTAKLDLSNKEDVSKIAAEYGMSPEVTVKRVNDIRTGNFSNEGSPVLMDFTDMLPFERDALLNEQGLEGTFLDLIGGGAVRSGGKLLFKGATSQPAKKLFSNLKTILTPKRAVDSSSTRIVGQNPFLVGPQLPNPIAPNLNIPAITRFQRAMQYGPVKP